MSRKNKENTYFTALLLLAALLAGLVFGALSVNRIDKEKAAEIYETVNGAITGGGQSFQSVFAASLRQNFIWLVVIWFLGLSAAGFVPIFICAALRGASVGFTVGFLVRFYRARGFFASFFAVLPHTLLTLASVLLISFFAVRLSVKILRGEFTKPREALVNYLTGTAAAAVLTAAAAVLEAGISALSIKLIL